MIIVFQNSKHTNQYKISANTNKGIFHENENCEVGVVFYLGKYCVKWLRWSRGSVLAEAVGFLGQKNPQHAFLWRGSEAVGPMS